ncbi:hypothetical protein [Atlantibacter subterraneus]|uniref:hypothetical protein n=1 Tax=Atlantibacter subterraneus TaxID=255519 RepID=UPI002FDE6D35
MTQYVAVKSADDDAICCFAALTRDPARSTGKQRYDYSVTVVHFRKVVISRKVGSPRNGHPVIKWRGYMSAYYHPANDDGRGKSSGVTVRCVNKEIVAEWDYFMCKRCDSGRTGYKTILEVRRMLNIPNSTSVWIRDLDVEGCPRYMVNSSGFVIAIQESDCEFWHLRQPVDGPDVKDGFTPVNGEFDEELADVGDTMNFDIRPDF